MKGWGFCIKIGSFFWVYNRVLNSPHIPSTLAFANILQSSSCYHPVAAWRSLCNELMVLMWHLVDRCPQHNHYHLWYHSTSASIGMRVWMTWRHVIYLGTFMGPMSTPYSQTWMSSCWQPPCAVLREYHPHGTDEELRHRMIKWLAQGHPEFCENELRSVESQSNPLTSESSATCLPL